MKKSSRAFGSRASIFHTFRGALYKKRVAQSVHQLIDAFGESAWLEAGRRQLKARTPAQTDLWRDVANEIVLKLRAARDTDGAKGAAARPSAGD